MSTLRRTRRFVLALVTALGLAGAPAALADGLLVQHFFPLSLVDTSIDCG